MYIHTYVYVCMYVYIYIMCIYDYITRLVYDTPSGYLVDIHFMKADRFRTGTNHGFPYQLAETVCIYVYIHAYVYTYIHNMYKDV